MVESTVTTLDEAVQPIDLTDKRFKKLRNRHGELLEGQTNTAEILSTAVATSEGITDVLFAPKDGMYYHLESPEGNSNGILVATPKQQKDDSHTVMSGHAVRQLATKIGLNRGFVGDMLASDCVWASALLCHAISDHAGECDERMLWRIAHSEECENGYVGGVLSDKYKRLDTGIIFGAFAEHCDKAGLTIVRGANTPTRSYLEAIEPTVRHIKLPNQGDHYAVFGIRLSNSEFGDGVLSLQLFDIRIQCHNLMMGGSIVRQRHIGQKIPTSADLSLKTRALESALMASRLADELWDVLTPNALAERVVALQAADTLVLDPTPLFEVLPKVGLTDKEVLDVSSVLATNDENCVPTGLLTRFKLAQAVAHVAVSRTNQRRRQLEDLSGAFVEVSSESKKLERCVAA